MKKRVLTAVFISAAALLMIVIRISHNPLVRYETFVKQNYSEKNIKVIMTDLTHDKRDEMIVLEQLETDYFSGIMHVYHISAAGDVVEIYRDEVAESHPGWRWYYLYKDADEQEYLLQYIPGIFGGSGVFVLDIISFSADGSCSRETIAEVTYDTTHFNEEQQRKMNVEMENFKELLFQYKNASKQLIGVGADPYMLEEDGSVQLFIGGQPDRRLLNA